MNDLWPIALAIAASPFPLIPAILLLFALRARATSTSFLLGWFVGVGVPTSVFVLASDLVEGSDYTPRWVSWTRLVLGTALVVYGIWEWLNRKAETAEPAWMRRLAEATPGSALRLALVLGFSTVASLSVAVPVGANLILGEPALGPLGKARDWLRANNAALMAVVMVVIGSVVGAKGLSGL